MQFFFGFLSFFNINQLILNINKFNFDFVCRRTEYSPVEFCVPMSNSVYKELVGLDSCSHAEGIASR
jgi:hypothetical protein